jgi:hypothetical protein
LTTASVLPNMSVWFALARETWSSKDMDVGAECFLRRPETAGGQLSWRRSERGREP